jgi:ketosteroid isomerase-like protein
MTQQSVEIVTRVLTAVEQRQTDSLRALYHPQIEFHWPPGLPYGGSFVGAAVAGMQKRFREIWDPLQPTEERRRMDFRIVATGQDGRVCVNYLWKGVDALNRRFETLTLAEYQVRDGLFARAQMYYYDLLGLVAFIEQAAAARGLHPATAGDETGHGRAASTPGQPSA